MTITILIYLYILIYYLYISCSGKTSTLVKKITSSIIIAILSVLKVPASS